MADSAGHREFIVAGNWKMHGSLAMVTSYAKRLHQAWDSTGGAAAAARVLLFPGFPHLTPLRDALQGLPVAVGAQNLHPATEGAFTGEVSGTMLRDLGLDWVIVGHSERRALFGETDVVVADKVAAALEAGFRVVLCVGETLPERRAGAAEARVLAQLRTALGRPGSVPAGRLVIAYEPVWAIGTGETATPELAQAMHECLRTWLLEWGGVEFAACSIVYGGSVNQDNAALLFQCPDLDGALVGGASLDPAHFLRIIAAGRAAAGNRNNEGV